VTLNLLHLRRDIESHRVNVVLCTELSRLSRSVSELAQFVEFLNEQGAQFVCLKQNYDTTTPQGRAFISIMTVLAQFEREMTAERTKDATAARSERGLHNGGNLYGYRADPPHKGYLLVDEAEAEVVRAAFASYLEVGSLAGTAEAMNARGCRTRTFTSRNAIAHPGHPWRLTLVQTMLKNVSYLGLKAITEPDGTVRVVEAVWPAIIDRDTFARVQALMAANGQHRTNQAKPIGHTNVLGGGLLGCGACGSPMEARSGIGRGKVAHYYYRCANKTCNMAVVASEIEGAILERLGVLAASPTVLEQLVAATNSRQQQLPALGRQRRALRRELADVNGQADALLADWKDLTASDARSFITEKLAALATRRDGLETAVRDVDAAITHLQAARLDVLEIQRALIHINEIYACLVPLEQKELFRILVHRAEVSHDKIVLELHTEALSAIAEGPAISAMGAKRFESPGRLPESVAQSVVYDEFCLVLPSLEARSRRQTRARRFQGSIEVAAEWQARLDSGVATTRAELARQLGVTRARVTQVLGDSGAPGRPACAGAVPTA
jgi:DNA invertase Pin-like site-specific DNA recombinase